MAGGASNGCSKYRRPPEVDESPFLRERDSLAKRLPVAGVLVYGFHGRAARYSEASPGYGRGRYIPDRSGEHGVHDGRRRRHNARLSEQMHEDAPGNEDVAGLSRRSGVPFPEVYAAAISACAGMRDQEQRF